MPEIVTEISATIVSAYLSNNSTAASEVSNLLAGVHAAVAQIMTGKTPEPIVSKPEPYTTIKKSVQHDAITCLACGKKFQTIKRHVGSDHGQSLAEYKAYWGLPESYPTTAPGYSERRSTLAFSLGLGKAKQMDEPAPAPAKKASKTKAETKIAAPKIKKKVMPHPKPKDRAKAGKAASKPVVGAA